MTMTTQNPDTTDARREVRQLFEGLLSSRGIRMDANGVRMWLDAFADLSAEEVATAIRRFNRESDPKQFPSPAAVRHYAGVRGVGDGARSSIAWAAVRKAVREHGPYASIEFDDRLINAVIRDMGGWPAFCESLDNPETMPFREKDFRERYHATSLSGVGDGSRLAGRIETDNRAKGIDPARLTDEARKRFGDAIPEHVTRRITQVARELEPVSIVTGLTPHPMARRLSASSAPRLECASPVAALIGVGELK